MDAAIGPDAPGPLTSAIHRALADERGYLLRLARRDLRDAGDAEDAVHDTLLAALQATSRFDGRSSVRTWLTSILRHRIADIWRRVHRRRDSSPIDPPRHDDETEPPTDLAVEHRDPQRLLEGRQSLAQLADGLQQMSPLAAQVLLLRKVEGLSNEETAARLRLDPRRVPAVLYRARRHLARRLGVPPQRDAADDFS